MFQILIAWFGAYARMQPVAGPSHIAGQLRLHKILCKTLRLRGSVSVTFMILVAKLVLIKSLLVQEVYIVIET
jgi:hypothetical protein